MLPAHLLTILLLAAAAPGLGADGDELKKAASKESPPEARKAEGAAGKDSPGLEVRDGVVYYEGRNLDEALKGIHKDLDKAAMERDKLALDLSGKADEKRLAELEAKIKSLEYQAGKYANLRKKALFAAEEKEEPVQEAAERGPAGGAPGQATAVRTGTRPGRGPTSGQVPVRGPRPGGTTSAERPEVPPQLLESQLDASGVGRTLSGMRTDAGALDQGYKETDGGFPGGGDGAGRLPGGGGGARSSAGPRIPGFDGAALPQNLSDPATPQDLVMAAMAGYRGTLKDLGLKVGTGDDGRPAILRMSGAPAGAGELQTLRERIRAEPRALLQRPDFFQVLGRPQHAELKQVFGVKPPEEKAFRHIALADDRRDFLWSATCAKLSGDCNQQVLSASYSKGQYVPPEDLRAVYESLDDAGEWVLDDDSDLKETRDKLSRSAFDGGGGLRGLMASIGRFFGGREDESAVSGDGGAVLSPESRLPGDAGARGTPGAGSGPSRGRRGDAMASAGPSAGVPPSAPRRSAPGSRWGLWIAAAVAAVFLIRVGLFRRPTSRE